MGHRFRAQDLRAHRCCLHVRHPGSLRPRETGRIKITVSKDRCGHVRRYEGSGRVIGVLELQSYPDGGVSASLEAPLPATQGPFRPTLIMEQMSKAIQDKPGMGVRELRAAVTGKNDIKDLAVEILITEGYITVEPGPNRQKRHLHKAPFSANDTKAGDDEAF